MIKTLFYLIYVPYCLSQTTEELPKQVEDMITLSKKQL